MAVMIIGGGVAGLAAAIAFRQAGVETTVYERADDVAAGQLGAGLGLAYNATRVLRKLGLLDQVLEAGCNETHFEFRTWEGKLLSQWDASEGEVQVAVTRRDLHRILVSALPADTLVPGKTCVRFEQDDSTVSAVFEDGTTESAELLIGADGLRSVVRAQLHGDDAPRYAGFSVSRALVRANADESPLPRGTFRLFWGKGACFGMYFVADERVYVFGWSKSPEGEHVPRGRRKETLLGQFGDWSAEVPELLGRAEEEEIHQTDIYDRPAVEAWGRGRVTLAGDAAHPMTFNMGQGACQGMEDAPVLARCIAEEGLRPEALRSYEVARMERAATFTKMSARVASLSVMDNPVGRTVRNVFLRRAGRSIARGDKMLMIEV